MFCPRCGTDLYGVSSEWSEWSFVDESIPIPYRDSSFLLGLRDEAINMFRQYKFVGRRINDDLRIMVVPSNRSEPAWFDQDGDLHYFFILYVIVR